MHSSTALNFATQLTAPFEIPPTQFRFGKRSPKGVFASRGFRSKSAQYICLAVYKPDAPEPNAKRIHCAGAWAIVLDDVGTKCKPLPYHRAPTWIVQTSPGNFQHGYALDKIVSAADAMATMRLLAERGYTDKGAATVPRWVRLPGRKHPTKNYITKLERFEPAERFTTDELLDAADTEATHEPNTNTPEIQSLEFAANDPILKFFEKKGLLLARKSSSGWRGIICPWHNQHSNEDEGGTDIARNEQGYAFKCLHGHCVDRSINDVYAWMREQGADKIVDAIDRFIEPERQIQIAAKRLAKAGIVSNVEPVNRVEGRPDYWQTLMRNEKGVLTNEENVALILTLDPAWAGVFEYDDFTRRIRVTRAPPGTKESARNFPRPATDSDELAALRWIQRTFKPFAKLKPATVRAVWLDVVMGHRTNSCVDYIEGLQWDGTARLGELLTRGFGAEAINLHAELGKRWMISAVARALAPGCQVDHALIAIGEQGIGKSSAFKILGGQWFSDHLPAMGSNDKDSAMLVNENWIIEFAELDALRRATDVSAIKSFITRREDKYRPPYGRALVDQPRHCVFAGSINPDGGAFLHDPTGGRRFWPFQAGNIDLAWIAKYRDQLWAEAHVAYANGQRWWLDAKTDRQLIAGVVNVQQEHTEQLRDTPMADHIERITKGRVEPIRLAELLTALGFDAASIAQQRSGVHEVSRVLHAMGWRKRQQQIDGERAWRWYPPSARILPFITLVPEPPKAKP